MFENRYVGDYGMMREYTNRVLCRKIQVMGAVIGPLGGMMAVAGGFRGDMLSLGVFGCAAFVAAFTALIGPWMVARQLMESDRRIHGGKRVETVTRFDARISLAEGDFSLTVDYGQIERIYFLQRGWALMFGKNNGLLLGPDGFVQGDKGAFPAFIRERCPKAIVYGAPNP